MFEFVKLRLVCFSEIYQIVSTKALDPGDPAPQIGDRARVLEISKQADPPKSDGKCC